MDNQHSLKKDVRRQSISRRDGIPEGTRLEMDRKVLGLISSLEEYKNAQRVLLYASYRSEVGTELIMEHAFSAGKEVVLPKVNEDSGCLTKHVVNGMEDLEAGFMGIPEPTTDACVRVEDVDFIVVPGVAFSAIGSRIGYGGGYYDKLLPRVKGVRPIVALAYEEQLFDGLPAEEHDISMDIIITPERIISCHG